ncbi:hypothetical protein MJM95_30240, partial [Salmonella enterica subsp. enterica serovar Anatum]|nr:hypothetical protein [Salmonella enterica subsp. enterica serovar Anatum]
MSERKFQTGRVQLRILSITRHTPLEWNFRVAVDFPAHWGQFVEVSLPRVGEAPIS